MVEEVGIVEGCCFTGMTQIFRILNWLCRIRYAQNMFLLPPSLRSCQTAGVFLLSGLRALHYVIPATTPSLPTLGMREIFQPSHTYLWVWGCIRIRFQVLRSDNSAVLLPAPGLVAWLQLMELFLDKAMVVVWKYFSIVSKVHSSMSAYFFSGCQPQVDQVSRSVVTNWIPVAGVVATGTQHADRWVDVEKCVPFIQEENLSNKSMVISASLNARIASNPAGCHCRAYLFIRR